MEVSELKKQTIEAAKQKRGGLMELIESQDDSVQKEIIEATQILRDKTFEKFKKENITSVRI